MPFIIQRSDITTMQADAIVNTANPLPIIGPGVDAGIHQKAGAALLAARKEIGRIAFGDAAITPAFGLNAKYVIHAVSPVWDGMQENSPSKEPPLSTQATALLESCYTKSLELALAHGCESIAFPLLAAGNNGFPKDVALQVAVSAFSKFLMKHEMQIYLVVFDQSAFALSEKLFSSVQSFIDDTYMVEKSLEEYQVPGARNVRGKKLGFKEAPVNRRVQASKYCDSVCEAPSEESALPPLPCGSTPLEDRATKPLDSTPLKDRSPKPMDSAPLMSAPMLSAPHTSAPSTSAPRKLENLMKEMDESFSERLIRLIDQRGMKDPDVYKRANIDRKLFSKIKNNVHYKPSKATAIAFAIALQLSLEETRDLIGRAGYALTHSSKFDIIIEYFLREGNYDIFEINQVLFAFDQPLIGG